MFICGSKNRSLRVLDRPTERRNFSPKRIFLSSKFVRNFLWDFSPPFSFYVTIIFRCIMCLVHFSSCVVLNVGWRLWTKNRHFHLFVKISTCFSLKLFFVYSKSVLKICPTFKGFATVDHVWCYYIIRLLWNVIRVRLVFDPFIYVTRRARRLILESGRQSISVHENYLSIPILF